MEALYRMESLCSEAFSDVAGGLFVLLRYFGRIGFPYRNGHTVLRQYGIVCRNDSFCQICPLTVRPSPMPDETEQPDRKTACSADLRFRFASCRRVYPPLSRRGAVRRLVPPVRPVRTLLGVPAFLVRCGGVFIGFRDGSSDRCANRTGQAVTRALRRCRAKRETGTRFVE